MVSTNVALWKSVSITGCLMIAGHAVGVNLSAWPQKMLFGFLLVVACAGSVWFFWSRRSAALGVTMLACAASVTYHYAERYSWFHGAIVALSFAALMALVPRALNKRS